MRKLLFVGPAPQGIGGISIHIRRLADMMRSDYMLDYVDEGHTRYQGMYNLRSGNLFIYLAKVFKANIIHIHSGLWFLRAWHIIICKILMRKIVVVTIHRDPNIEPFIALTKWLLKQCNYAILVNKEGYETMKCNGKCKYLLQPAFLPPNMDDEAPLPEGIITWIDNIRKIDGSYLMCSNAWNLVMNNGQDLYGVDMCIQAMERLKENKEAQYYLVFVVASNTEQKERMANYKKQIIDNGLEDRILIWEQPVSFVRLLKLCDLVLRTTNTDGDAVSIREALYFEVPVLASDVVKRPEGVGLFATRDVEGLIKGIQKMASLNVPVEIPQPVSYYTLYHNIYENVE